MKKFGKWIWVAIIGGVIAIFAFLIGKKSK
jgi:hypothetical protein